MIPPRLTKQGKEDKETNAMIAHVGSDINNDVGVDRPTHGCLHSHARLMARNAWWILPFLSFLGLADLIIAILDLTPGLPMAFEVVYLCFEMMSLTLLCLVSVPVLLFFFTHSRCILRSQRQRGLLIAWLLAIPISFTAIIKSSISLILKARGIHLIQMNYAGISLAALLLTYDMILCFFDMPSFDKIIEGARVRNSNSPHHHNCMCSECTGIWPTPQIFIEDEHEDCSYTSENESVSAIATANDSGSGSYELSEIIHGDVVAVIKDGDS